MSRSARNYGLGHRPDSEEIVLGTAMILMGENSRTPVACGSPPSCSRSTPWLWRPTATPVRAVLVNKPITAVQNLAEGATFIVVLVLHYSGVFRAAGRRVGGFPLSMLMLIIGIVDAEGQREWCRYESLDLGLIVDGALIIMENFSYAWGTTAWARPECEHDDACTPSSPATHKKCSRQQLRRALVVVIMNLPIFALTQCWGRCVGMAFAADHRSDRRTGVVDDVRAARCGADANRRRAQGKPDSESGPPRVRALTAQRGAPSLGCCRCCSCARGWRWIARGSYGYRVHPQSQ